MKRNPTPKKHPYSIILAVLLTLTAALPVLAEEASDGLALEFGTMKPSSSQVTYEPSPEGFVVNISPGSDGYPGLGIQPPNGTSWDLSDYGHVSATLTNTGDTGVSVSLRVDNAGNWKDNPWNTESTSLKPGETKTVTVIFGYAYGKKPSYKLNPAKVTQILLFTGKVKKDVQYRIDSIAAAGPAGEKPPVDPASIRIAPEEGVILGAKVKLSEDQVAAKDGATATLIDGGAAIEATFDKGKDGKLYIKPSVGKWDLRQAVAVAFRIKNTGSAPASPRVRVNSKSGSTDIASAELAPGEEKYITASFVPKEPWTGITGSEKTSWQSEKGTGTKFTSNAVDSVAILADSERSGQKLRIDSIIAGAPAKQLPDWVGKRPPVEGDWTMTFNEDFNGDTIDLTRWNIYTPNYWDKRSHFSKDNVIVKDGVCILRYEKKTGFHGDNPEGKQTDYATGFIDTYGKWVQRYGYFEARMKLPPAPGLWPAFWLMPDRGLQAGEQWKRADTGKGGMEFDVMEFLSGWGPYRYNIAWHWDGYGKGHQQTGSTCIYYEPDPEGYITAGVLWLPGKSVYYANGEVVAQWDTPRMSNVPSDMMFTHVSGGWDNLPIDDSQLPSDFVIDYVRAWQRADLASDVDGVQSTQPTPAAPTKPDSTDMADAAN